MVQTGCLCDIRKGAIAIVPIQDLSVAIVCSTPCNLTCDEGLKRTRIGDEQVEIGIVVHVQKEGNKSIRNRKTHASRCRYISERAVSIVPIENVRLSVIDDV